RSAGGGGRGLHDQHAARGDAGDQLALPGLFGGAGPQGGRRDPGTDREAAARGVPGLRGADALAQMKTPRRSFLTLLGGAFFARGLRPGEDLFPAPPPPAAPPDLLSPGRPSFAGGEPLITVRVLEGRHQIVFVPRGPLTVLARLESGALRPAVKD